jgi:hypothetical protein
MSNFVVEIDTSRRQIARQQLALHAAAQARGQFRWSRRYRSRPRNFERR